MNNDLKQRINLAAESLDALKGVHDEFIKRQSAIPMIDQHAGMFGIENKTIMAVCLGVELKVTWRPVVDHDGAPKMMEYLFAADYKDGELVVFAMYLYQNGTFFRDPELKTKLWAYSNNLEISSEILSLIADAMLKSKLFAPTRP